MAEAVAEAVGPVLGLVISAAPKIFKAAEEVATNLVELVFGFEVALEEDEEVFDTGLEVALEEEEEIFDTLRLDKVALEEDEEIFDTLRLDEVARFWIIAE